MNIKSFLLTLSLLLIDPLMYTNQTIQLIQSTHGNHCIQPIKKNSCFFNTHSENRTHHLLDAAKIFSATVSSTQPYFTEDYSPWIQHDTVLQNSIPLQIQWIGHASFLIQINNLNILTDPLFYDLNAIVYPRKTPVGIKPADLPHIDFVIISHNHRDHLDEPSMKILKSHQPILLVPTGTKSWFTKRGFKHVLEHTWWQETTFRRNDHSITFTFVPAVHWSGRNGIDAHASLWGGWILKTDTKTVYFAGDTAFNKPIFKAIARYAGTIDCALLPIGPCEPRHLMCHSHMGPQEAVAAYKILKPQLFIPMHWGTFRLGPDSFDAPIKCLDLEWKARIPLENQDRLYKIKFGERISL